MPVSQRGGGMSQDSDPARAFECHAMQPPREEPDPSCAGHSEKPDC